jgi:hypothetical protein
VIQDQARGPHPLTYRQVEHTARLITTALGKDKPDGAPSPQLQAVCDTMITEASIPEWARTMSSSLAVD